MHTSICYLNIIIGTLFIGRAAWSEDSIQYNREIRPILADQCFACHGADSAARKADLRLDQRDAAINSGAITEGQPDDSELITRIMTNDGELLMPPPETKKKLTLEQKTLLTKWIASGAETNHTGHSYRPSVPRML